MKTVPGGKFCSSCDKKVIDFTLLNDRQVLEVFRKNEHVCGRFMGEQLNRELRVTRHQSNAFIPAAIISTALITSVVASAYAAKDITRKLPLTAQDSIVPIQTIRCTTVVSKDLVVKPFTDTCTQVRLGGAQITGVHIEDNTPENDLKWFWFFR
jgi:hypothetical protein